MRKSAVDSIKNVYLNKNKVHKKGSYQLYFKHYYQLFFENHRRGQTMK